MIIHLARPPTTTTEQPPLIEDEIKREISKLQKELGNKNTWVRRVKEKRLQYLMDKLNKLHDQITTVNTVTPVTFDPSKFVPTTNSSPNFSTDDSIISVINLKPPSK